MSFHIGRYRKLHKNQIINRLERLSIKIGNDKETSELPYSTLFCLILKERPFTVKR